jgi:hypothetical protein
VNDRLTAFAFIGRFVQEITRVQQSQQNAPPNAEITTEPENESDQSKKDL